MDKAISGKECIIDNFEISIPVEPIIMPMVTDGANPFDEMLHAFPQEELEQPYLGTHLYDDVVLASAMAKIDQTEKTLTTGKSSVDVSGAIDVNLDTVYTIADFTANHVLLLKVTLPSLTKLSAVIRFSAAVSVETTIFSVDEENNPTILADNTNMISNFNIASYVPQTAGTYYVLFSVFSGGGTAALLLQSSTVYSASEPNDSPDQAALRNEAVYAYDTFDNAYDIDFVRLKISTAGKYLISLGFEDKDLTAVVDIGIYHKTDADGNVVDSWVNYLQGKSIPNMFLEWNVDTAGEFYIFVQYISGDVLNQPYILSVRSVNDLPQITYVKTGEKGITGVQSGMAGDYHWVMGAFKVIANFKSSLTKNVDGVYPAIVTGILLVGKDKNGEFDYTSNANYSDNVLSTPEGIATISALLPYTYGNDGSFQGAVYTHKFDYNRVLVGYLTYSSTDGKYALNYSKYPYVYFDPFLNVSE